MMDKLKNKRSLIRLIVAALVALLFIRFTFGRGLLGNLIFRQDIAQEFLPVRKHDNQSCLCEGENFCFPGLNDQGQRVYGIRFDCSLRKFLVEYNLTEKAIVTAQSDIDKIQISWKPIFVTAASSNHFEELLKLIKDISDIYNGSKIVIHDIGLSKNEADTVKSVCNVEYRLFNLSKYPDHVGRLQTYAFKLVVPETLKTYKSFFYFDTSVRFKPRFHENIVSEVKQGRIPKFATFTSSGHSVFAALNPAMSSYLPLPPLLLKTLELQSSAQFVSDSPYTRYVMRWWTLCALTEQCIAPQGARVSCNTRVRDRMTMFMNCHRFDQAFWNIAQLGYLFDPHIKGALRLSLAQRWPETFSDDFVEDVIRHRDSRFLEASKDLSVERENRYSGPLPQCKVQ